ncbi:hypothetical protein V6N13_110872 [Hibiscus sabdariffa]
MTSSGSWDPSLLLSILPEHAVNHILSYRCPNPNDLKDFYRWRWNPQFTISEAYAKLMEEDAFTAELWAVFEGLTIAKQLGFKLVQIQSDCSKAISEFMGYKLIMLICIHPHSSEASICSDNMLGSSNSFGYPADARVKLTPPSHFELIRYTNPQNLLCDLLDRDISGPPYYRSACN